LKGGCEKKHHRVMIRGAGPSRPYKKIRGLLRGIPRKERRKDYQSRDEKKNPFRKVPKVRRI